jgi:hypothetical protein
MSEAEIIDRTDAAELRERWVDIQTRFVDDPRDSVAEADELVSDAIDAITAHFEGQRETLERRWREGEEVSTEDLRRTLQSYRSFFKSLLPAE